MSEESLSPLTDAVRPAESGGEMSIPSQVSTPAPRSNLLREIIETILLTAIIFLVVNAAVGRFRIESVSMQPNLYEGEYVIVDKITYLLHPPERGDIIVFKHPNEDLIKRVIGLPGDTVQVGGGQVIVNSVALNEPYLAQPVNYEMPARQIEPGHYFVLGDNRNNSSDSHIWGTVAAGDIIGRAWLIYWPPPKWEIVPRYTYAAAVWP